MLCVRCCRACAPRRASGSPRSAIAAAAIAVTRRSSCRRSAAAPERLAVPVDKMNAMGKGPLVLALRESANAIAGATPASIVLVADDLDNCGQDVCAAMGGILAASPNLVVHTVAVGFDKAKLAHIACIAQQTGGKLWDAQDAAGVISALGQAVTLANLQTNTDAPAATADAAAAPKNPTPARLPAYTSRPAWGRPAQHSTIPSIGASPRPAPTARWCATSARPRSLRS